MLFLYQFLDLLLTVLTIAIFLRAIMSWFRLGADNPISIILTQVTEPILAPLRRVVPSLGLFDITPMVAIVLLSVVQRYILPALL